MEEEASDQKTSFAVCRRGLKTCLVHLLSLGGFDHKCVTQKIKAPWTPAPV